MNRLLLISAFVSFLALTGCERKQPPDVKPPEPGSIPGPAHPPTGSLGEQMPQGALHDGKSDKAAPAATAPAY